jgi:HK97 family phage prohead protease
MKLQKKKIQAFHPKIEALKLKAKPINSPSYVDADGVLHLVDSEGNPVDFKVKVLDVAARTIEGYLSVFNVRDLCGEMTVKGTFAKSISERGPKSGAKAKIAFLWQHNMQEPIGQIVELKEDNYGLYFKAVLDNVPRGLQALEQINSGTLNQFSFGYKYVWDKTKYDEETDTIVLLEVKMYEGSVVTLGCNPETYAIKSIEDLMLEKEKLEEEMEDFLSILPENRKNEFRQLMTKQAHLTSLEPQYEEQLKLKEALKPKPEGSVKGIKWGDLNVKFKKENKNESKKIKW